MNLLKTTLPALVLASVAPMSAEVAHETETNHRPSDHSIQKNSNIAFTGKVYRLKEVIMDKSGGINNAYVEANHAGPQPAMLVIRHWPDAKEIAEIDSAWIKAIEGSVLTKIRTFTNTSEGSLANDIYHVAWCGDPKNDGYFQAIFVRFTIEKGSKGIKSYESSVAIDVHGPDWSTPYGETMQLHLDALKLLALPAFKKMPD